MHGLLTRETALFLDFDGTLAAIQDDPSTVVLPEGGGEVLVALGEILDGALALVSGRDARDLARRVPGRLWRAGNHGDILLPPDTDEPSRVERAPQALIDGARMISDRYEGVRLEEKARVICLHWRMAPQHEEAVAKAADRLATETPGYKVQHGKGVTELKPEGVHKGAAVERLLAEPAFRGRPPLFIGDDTTDEDGFLAAIHRGGSAIKVGDGKTLAPHRLKDPEAVWNFLRKARDDLS